MISSACLPISAPPGTRDQVVSTPSMMSLVAMSPSSTRKLAVRGPLPKLPNVPEALGLVHRPAARGNFTEGNAEHRIGAADFDVRAGGGGATATSAAEKVVLHQAFGLPRFQIVSWSGNAFGSPASLNASPARMAEATWCPCWPGVWFVEKPAMTTSG